MRKLVLLVDDDRLPMQFYVRALEESGFQVKQFLEPDGALVFAKEKKDEIDAIILDIMLPPGQYGHQKTNEGLKTGICLLEDLRKHCPDVRVVVLTNVKNPETLAEFEGKRLIRTMQKTECPPFELAELVAEMLATKQTR